MESQYQYSAINDQRHYHDTHDVSRNDSPSPEPGYIPNNLNLNSGLNRISSPMSAESEVSPISTSNRGHFREMFSPEPESLGESDEILEEGAESRGLDPGIASRKPVSEERKKRPGLGRRFDRAGSWAWEIGGCGLSIASLAILTGFLAYVDGREYNGSSSWERSISPNTVVSIISTVAKAAMLVPVASCLGQLKWINYQSPKPLFHMQVLDQASRGPVGALESMWTIAPGLATFGAAVMVFAVAFDPFAQQMLSYPIHRVEVDVDVNGSESSFVQSADQYWPDWTKRRVKNDFLHSRTTRGLEPAMQAAIFSGLTQSNYPLVPVCSSSSSGSGECEFDDFVTLGVCSQCEDVTEQARQDCQAITSTDDHRLYTEQWMEEIPLNCTYTTSSGASITPAVWVDDAVWVSQDNYSAYAIPYPWTAVSLNESIATTDGDPAQLVSFLSAKYEGGQTWTSKNNTKTEDKPTLTECVLSLCERKYTHASTNTRSLNETDANNRSLQQSGLEMVKSQDLYLGQTIESNITDIYLKSLSAPNGTTQLAPETNYTIENSTLADLSLSLTGLFNSSLTTGDAQYIEQVAQGLIPILALWSSTNLSESMDSMATSMTDHIRLTSAERIPGRTFRDGAYIHVRWAWIALPAVLIFLASVFLVVVAVRNRKVGTWLWKGSVLPLLLGNVSLGPGRERVEGVESVTEAKGVARDVRVAVECEVPWPDLRER